MGMDIIETGDPDAFKRYLLDTDNTICGRHPISVFLHVSPQLIKNSIPLSIRTIHICKTVLFLSTDAQELLDEDDDQFSPVRAI